MEKTEQRLLKRSVGLWSAVAINVGAIIGGGIFVVTGIVAGYAGSAIVVSMVISGAIAFFTAWNFAILTAWQPVEGSVYEYGRQLISPYAGFLAGWMWIVSNTFTGAAVSLGFAYYLTAAFPSLPIGLTAAVLCLGFTGLNLVGIRKSTGVNNALVGIKLAVLGFFVIFGALYINGDNFIPFIPLSSGVLYGTFFMFFAYGGFARVAVIAEEVKDAKRNVPKAMLLSLGISMAIYVSVGLIAVGLLGPIGLAGSASPLSSAAGVTGNPFAVQIVSIGGLVATASVLLTAILGVSRMAYSMARRNDLPSILARLHNRFFTPYYAILTSGSLMAILVLFVDLTRVVAISTFALLFYYSIINVAAFKLRTNHKHQRIMPLLGLGSLILLLGFILFASTDAWIIGIIFIVLGTVYYKVLKKFQGKVEKTF